MTRTRNHILAMSVATILVLSAFGVALPALSPIPVYAPNENDNNNNNNNGNNNNGDNNNNGNNDDEMQLLIDLVECFNDNNSNDLEDCLNDAIDDYFNNGNNNNNNNNGN